MAPTPGDSQYTTEAVEGRRRRHRHRHRQRRRDSDQNACTVRPLACGLEAACQPAGDSFECICPHDLSRVEPGQRCRRYTPGTVSSSSGPTSPPAPAAADTADTADTADAADTADTADTADITTPTPGAGAASERTCVNPEQLCGAEAACQPLGVAGYRCICLHDSSEPTGNSPQTYRCNRNTAEAVPTSNRPCPNPKELCGMEAACQSMGLTGYQCICPHDLSKPIGNSPETFRCNRKIVDGDSSPSPYNLSSNTEHAPNSSAMPGWVLVLVPAVLLLVLLVLIVVLVKRRCCARRTMQRDPPYTLQDRKVEPPITIPDDIVFDDRVHSNPNYYHESPTSSPLSSMRVVQILKEQIVNMSEIGQGQFGKVYKGVYLPVEGEPVDVAVKLLKETANVELQEDFIREVEIMASCKHAHIVSLLGVLVQENGVTPWMVFEYMAYGDLAELLRSHAPKWGSPHSSALSMEMLHSFASQVASGMQYLASQHFVHRDLACRNILVGNNMAVKISDFGMSRDIYTCDYYKVAGGSRMLPVRWMSPESISYGKFTLESDVWSYGVVLWEIYAYGKQPYYGHSNKEVVSLILRHILLIPPETCPSAVCHIMEACWRSEPHSRIDFTEVVKRLDEMSATLGSHRYSNMEATVPYTELEHDLHQLARIEAEVRALGLGEGDVAPPVSLEVEEPLQLSLDQDMYLQPDPRPEHIYIQPVP